MSNKFNLREATVPLCTLVDKLKAAQMRACVVLSGSKSWQQANLIPYLSTIQSGIWVGDAPNSTILPPLISVPSQKAKHYLGQETQCVVFSAEMGIEPNSLGILSGMIQAGGLCIILCPPHQDGLNFANPAMQKYLNTPAQLSDLLKGFNQYLWQQCQQHALLFEEGQAFPPLPKLPKASTKQLPTLDQQQAIKAIERVAFGHRHRPLVIQAERGRGKSYCLGLATLQLIQQGKTHIVITAARPDQAQQVLSVIQASQQNKIPEKIHFIPPDKLIQSPENKPDILLIDEAAHLPLPMLEQLLSLYPRVVLATTTQGYEGSGKGFVLKLTQGLPALSKLNWRFCELKMPIRWQAGDLLEQTLHQLFFKEAKIVKQTENKALNLSKLKVTAYDSALLLKKPEVLNALFDLMCQAHYQTTPNDLMQWLEMPNLKIWLAQQEDGKGHQLIGAVIAVEEGGLPIEPSLPKKLQGHLMPRWLTKHTAQPQWLGLKSLRVMRIAVQPWWQQQGIGSQLLSVVKAEQQPYYDYLSASFGATAKLSQFWHKHGFKVVGLGVKKDKASGLNSQLSVWPISKAAVKQVQMAQTQFKTQFSHQLMVDFNQLDSDLVIQLLRQLNYAKTPFPIGYLAEDPHWQQPYEAISAQLKNWLLTQGQALSQCSDKEVEWLIQKILQNHPWKHRKQTEKQLKMSLLNLFKRI